MKQTILTIFCIIGFGTATTLAQNAHFSFNGTVEYDKTVNMYALIKKYAALNDQSYMQQAYDAYKKSQPQFKVLKSTLQFNRDRTLFTPIIPETVGGSSFFSDAPMLNQNNIVYTDLLSGTSTCQKTVFEETFLVKDTTRRIKWKITDEKRDIAGYTCRRANAIIMDSIYVVAFYTDEIPVSGGPESFTGLPGMILGVALPHENITWFATKVTETIAGAKPPVPPAKGKPINSHGLLEKLKLAMNDWGKYAQMSLKAFML